MRLLSFILWEIAEALAVNMLKNILIRFSTRYPNAYSQMYKSRYLFMAALGALGIGVGGYSYLSSVSPTDIGSYLTRLSGIESSVARRNVVAPDVLEGMDVEEFKLTDPKGESVSDDEMELIDRGLSDSEQPEISDREIKLFDGDLSKLLWIAQNDPKFKGSRESANKLAEFVQWRQQFEPAFKYKDPPLAWRTKAKAKIMSGTD